MHRHFLLLRFRQPPSQYRAFPRPQSIVNYIPKAYGSRSASNVDVPAPAPYPGPRGIIATTFPE
jgi:hypothetical protein